jgi:hypoxanthine-DNA glycosylase
MPGIKSLEAQEYYAHPQNQFWKIMAKLLRHAWPLTYAQKKKMLLKNHIALWDVVASCKRKGSLDSNIRGVEFNDFAGLFKKYKNLRAVYCNGNTAYKLFKKYSCCDLPVLALPSTSPAYTKSFGWKTREWKQLCKDIGDE